MQNEGKTFLKLPAGSLLAKVTFPQMYTVTTAMYVNSFALGLCGSISWRMWRCPWIESYTGLKGQWKGFSWSEERASTAIRRWLPRHKTGWNGGSYRPKGHLDVRNIGSGWVSPWWAVRRGCGWGRTEDEEMERKGRRLSRISVSYGHRKYKPATREDDPFFHQKCLIPFSSSLPTVFIPYSIFKNKAKSCMGAEGLRLLVRLQDSEFSLCPSILRLPCLSISFEWGSPCAEPTSTRSAV